MLSDCFLLCVSIRVDLAFVMRLQLPPLFLIQLRLAFPFWSLLYVPCSFQPPPCVLTCLVAVSHPYLRHRFAYTGNIRFLRQSELKKSKFLFLLLNLQQGAAWIPGHFLPCDAAMSAQATTEGSLW